MARRKRVRPSRHNRTVVLVQVVGLMLILAFVLIFRNNLGVATSALFESMAPEDVRVAPGDATEPGAPGEAATSTDGGAAAGAREESPSRPAQAPEKTSDK